MYTNQILEKVYQCSRISDQNNITLPLLTKDEYLEILNGSTQVLQISYECYNNLFILTLKDHNEPIKFRVFPG